MAAADSPSLFDSIAATVETAATAVEATPAPTVRKRRKLATSDVVDQRATRKALVIEAGATLPDDRIGSLVWWSASEIKVDASTLAFALMDADDARPLPTDKTFADLVPSPALPATAIRRAMGRRQHTLTAEGMRWHDVGNDDAGNTIVGLGVETANAKKRDWSADLRLVVIVANDGTVTRPTSLVSGDDLDDEDEQAVEQLLARYDVERGQLTAPDVGKIATSILLDRLGGVRVKTGGGVYFVPRGPDEAVDRVTAALALAGVTLLRLPAGRDSAPAFVGFARDALLEDVKRVTEAAHDAEARATAAFIDGNTKSAPTWEAQQRRLDEIHALKQRAELLETLLGSLHLDVSRAVAAAEKATDATLDMLPGGKKTRTW
jgi:hypothetical protein